MPTVEITPLCGRDTQGMTPHYQSCEKTKKKTRNKVFSFLLSVPSEQILSFRTEILSASVHNFSQTRFFPVEISPAGAFFWPVFDPGCDTQTAGNDYVFLCEEEIHWGELFPILSPRSPPPLVCSTEIWHSRGACVYVKLDSSLFEDVFGFCLVMCYKPTGHHRRGEHYARDFSLFKGKRIQKGYVQFAQTISLVYSYASLRVFFARES